MILSGHVIKYGDNIDTDVIIPARRLNTSDPKELAQYCMEDLDKTFHQRVREGDVMAAGQNFGCGSSREHAPIAIKASGISCVVAKSFARIFYRNAINIGLPILECPEAADGISDGDKVEIDLGTGIIRNVTAGEAFKAEPFPPFIQKIVSAGGLIEAIEQNVLEGSGNGI